MLVRLSHVRLANMFPYFSVTVACHNTTTVGNPGISRHCTYNVANEIEPVMIQPLLAILVSIPPLYI